MNEQYQGKPAEGFKPLTEWGQVEVFSDEERGAWKRSPVSRLEARTITTITGLERQLAEAQAERESFIRWGRAIWHRFMWEAGHAEVERDEAQGQCDVARERACVLAESLHRHHSDETPPCDGCSPTARLAILGEKGE